MSGFNYVANTFVSVGKAESEMTLADIVPSDITLYTTTIQLLDDTGATATTSEYEDLGEVYLDRKSVVGKECRSRWSPYH